MRTGHGYDVHKLVTGRKLVLGGIEIHYAKGLLGHSDADVLIHAIIDALLGAAALGDIGLNFPDNEDKYLNIDSTVLLKEVCILLKAKGYSISNIDSTLIVQEPKIKPYIQSMRQKISTVCEISLDCINIKATTEEGLGFTGSKEGIAAHAVCLIN